MFWKNLWASVMKFLGKVQAQPGVQAAEGQAIQAVEGQALNAVDGALKKAPAPVTQVVDAAAGSALDNLNKNLPGANSGS